MPGRGRDETGTFRSAAPGGLGRYGAQHPLPIGEGAQIALAVDAVEFEAGDLGDCKAGLRHPDGQKGLDFESVTPDAGSVGWRRLPGVGKPQGRKDVGPEGVVAVAQVGEFCAEAEVAQHVEPPVPRRAEAGQINRAASRHVTRSLGKVCAVNEGLNERRNLAGIG